MRFRRMFDAWRLLGYDPCNASCRVSACALPVHRRHGKGSDVHFYPCFQTGAGTTHTVRFGSIGLGGMRVPFFFPFFEFA